MKKAVSQPISLSNEPHLHIPAFPTAEIENNLILFCLWQGLPYICPHPEKNQGFFSHLSPLFPVSPTFISSRSSFTNFISLLDHSHQHTNMLLISPIFQNHSLELTLVSYFSACSAVKLERAVYTPSTSSHPSPI